MSLEEFHNFAKKKNIKFDVITFFEVLEHQDRPMEFLQMVKELLKDGEYIAGSVPNRERLFVKIDWKYFHGDYPPHHFLIFSQTALYRTFKLAGFKNIEIIKLDFPKEALPSYLEKKLFGNIDKLKIWLKSKAVENHRIAISLAVEDMNKFSCSNFVLILKIFKKLRNIILYSFALPYWSKLKENGIHLYFQAVNHEK
ncbi:MAG TPA: methyltransferase domain-containing protein [Candidatus Desulfofervidus auxilii]|uniref:Methyltransferase domain-containing protein n=1 Tax=Desulfofervidus auxilii TaxID=1621989 RepID=A0A7C0Y5J9_DESA2|nr:methyltransferase domain-containing protein [Candidatus Desulfofervidus auxilii]